VCTASLRAAAASSLEGGSRQSAHAEASETGIQDGTLPTTDLTDLLCADALDKFAKAGRGTVTTRAGETMPMTRLQTAG
jgi:hypothetical protein